MYTLYFHNLKSITWSLPFELFFEIIHGFLGFQYQQSVCQGNAESFAGGGSDVTGNNGRTPDVAQVSKTVGIEGDAETGI